MRRLERIIQALYYALILVFFFGGVFYNGEPLIPFVAWNALLIAILAGIVFFLEKYCFFSKKPERSIPHPRFPHNQLPVRRLLLYLL